jgi:hypothetical protein
MNARVGWQMVLASLLLGLTAQLAVAGSVVTAKGILCGGSGPHPGSIAVTGSDSGLTLKFRVKDLTPFQAVRCGYECAFIGTRVDVPCGMVDQSGRWSHRLERPTAVCWGFLPFFNTGTTGSCMSGTAP